MTFSSSVSLNIYLLCQKTSHPRQVFYKMGQYIRKAAFGIKKNYTVWRVSDFGRSYNCQYVLRTNPHKRTNLIIYCIGILYVSKPYSASYKCVQIIFFSSAYHSQPNLNFNIKLNFKVDFDVFYHIYSIGFLRIHI